MWECCEKPFQGPSLPWLGAALRFRHSPLVVAWAVLWVCLCLVLYLADSDPALPTGLPSLTSNLPCHYRPLCQSELSTDLGWCHWTSSALCVWVVWDCPLLGEVPAPVCLAVCLGWQLPSLCGKSHCCSLTVRPVMQQFYPIMSTIIMSSNTALWNPSVHENDQGSPGANRNGTRPCSQWQIITGTPFLSLKLLSVAWGRSLAMEFVAAEALVLLERNLYFEHPCLEKERKADVHTRSRSHELRKKPRNEFKLD